MQLQENTKAFARVSKQPGNSENLLNIQQMHLFQVKLRRTQNSSCVSIPIASTCTSKSWRSTHHTCHQASPEEKLLVGITPPGTTASILVFFFQIGTVQGVFMRMLSCCSCHKLHTQVPTTLPAM